MRVRHLISWIVLFSFVIAAFAKAPEAARAETGAEPAQIVRELSGKGAKFTESGGAVTGIDLPDLTSWTDDDFRHAAQLTHLQKLSFGRGITDHQLELLIHLPDVTAFTTNGAQLSDQGVKLLASFKRLKVLTFFHPGKDFTGTGLAELSALPDLENLTVAGTSTFGNTGMEAVAQLPHLTSLRVFHANPDSAGVAKIAHLDKLVSITLGQRLSFKPPAMVADDTIGILLSLKSLESISLMESRLSLEKLSQLKQLPKLKRLVLDGIEMPESDVDLLRKQLPGVQIKWTPPTPDNMKRIKGLLGEK